MEVKGGGREGGPSGLKPNNPTGKNVIEYDLTDLLVLYILNKTERCTTFIIVS